MDNVLYGAVATGKGSEGDDAPLAEPGAEDACSRVTMVASRRWKRRST